MALLINYENHTDAYLKASPTTLTDYFQDEVSPKKFITYVIYYVYTDSSKTESLTSGGFEMEFNPLKPIYGQVYEHMKENYFPEYREV